MNKWTLKIELNGEWEECTFGTSEEALNTFASLAADYTPTLRRAILFSPDLDQDELFSWPRTGQTGSGYVN